MSYAFIASGQTCQKRPVLEDISLSYFYGAKIGVLGLNGAGKSLLLRIMAGEDRDFNGEVVFSPGYSVGMLAQEPALDPDKTVRQVVEEGVAGTVALLDEFNRINEQFAEPMDAAAMDRLLARQAEVQDKLDAADAWDLDARLEMAMEALRCPEGDTPVPTLSGGERRRVALCRLLLQKPDILLLDEPTNHLDAETVAWLEHHLQQYPGTVIAVTHDRYFLDNVAGWILELDRGRGIPWKGNYSSWLEQKQERLRREEKAESQRHKTLARELDVNTMRALEEALENFAGCAVVISHDRWFLDRIATHILAFEGDSRVVWFEGNYSDYEADRRRRLGEAVDHPHRIKYRQLTRQ
jgi:ATPase subunit of ABC transporter with duplicated ATPase domains